MKKPINKYCYYSWVVKDYDNWAEQAYHDGDCMLESTYAERLEQIYNQKEYNEQQHKENIAFLDKVQMELNHVWSYSVRGKSNMTNLVEDYKEYFGIK